MQIPKLDIGLILMQARSTATIKGDASVLATPDLLTVATSESKSDVSSLLRREIHQYLSSHSPALPKAIEQDGKANQKMHHQLATLVEGLLVGKGKQAMLGAGNAETRQALAQTMKQLQLEIRQWLSATITETPAQSLARELKEELPAPMANILHLSTPQQRAKRRSMRQQNRNQPMTADDSEFEEEQAGKDPEHLNDAVQSIVDWLCRQRSPIDYCAVGHSHSAKPAAKRGQLLDDSI